MLQQTRVDTVVDYFERWMARFPTVEALAAADLAGCAQGVGRVGLLCPCAQPAQGRPTHRGRARRTGCPTTRAAILDLPGIGAYTAGAILSLAYAQPEPILDGNVKRVLARLFDIDRPIDDPAVLRELWSLARVTGRRRRRPGWRAIATRG